MKSLLLVTLACLSMAGTAFGAVKGEDVSYEGDGITMKGYLAYDDAAEGKRPGILVVHEWWGHNQHARNAADKLAAAGYTALAVDMYGDGKTADHPEDAGKFAAAVMGNLESMKARFNAAEEFLKSQPTVDSGKIGAIGYCFGGGVILNMARQGADLKAVVSFHGSLATSAPATAGSVKGKVLVCTGGADPFVPEAAVNTFKKEFDAAGADYDVIVYDGVKHSFTNPDADSHGMEALAYNKEAAEASWESMLNLFNEVF